MWKSDVWGSSSAAITRLQEAGVLWWWTEENCLDDNEYNITNASSYLYYLLIVILHFKSLLYYLYKLFLRAVSHRMAWPVHRPAKAPSRNSGGALVKVHGKTRGGCKTGHWATAGTFLLVGKTIPWTITQSSPFLIIFTGGMNHSHMDGLWVYGIVLPSCTHIGTLLILSVSIEDWRYNNRCQQVGISSTQMWSLPGYWLQTGSKQQPAGSCFSWEIGVGIWSESSVFDRINGSN